MPECESSSLQDDKTHTTNRSESDQLSSWLGHMLRINSHFGPQKSYPLSKTGSGNSICTRIYYVKNNLFLTSENPINFQPQTGLSTTHMDILYRGPRWG